MVYQMQKPVKDANGATYMAHIFKDEAGKYHKIDSHLLRLNCGADRHGGMEEVKRWEQFAENELKDAA